MMKRWLRSKRFWLLVILGIGLAVLSSQFSLVEGFLAFRKWFTPPGFIAIPVFIFIYLIATVLGLPNFLLILVGGATFGFWKGLLAVSIADTLGAIACFWIGRTLARERVKQWMNKNPQFANLDHAVGQKGWKILLLTRLSPLVPSNLLNYGFSCTKVSFWQYTFFSWLGMLPVLALYVYLGSFGVRLLQEGITPQKVAIQVAGLALAIAAAIYVTRIVRKTLNPPCAAESIPADRGEKERV